MVLSKNVGTLEETLCFSILSFVWDKFLTEWIFNQVCVCFKGLYANIAQYDSYRVCWMKSNLDEQRFKSVRVCNGFKLFFIFLNIL